MRTPKTARCIVEGALVFTLSTSLLAQSLAFEVASVKLNTSGELAGGFATSPVGYTITNYSLLRLISAAYQLQEFRIIGGPSWRNTDRFDVVAKAAEGSNPTRQELNLM